MAGRDEKPMRCARCGTENPESSRFCMECGAPLTAEEPHRPAPQEEPPASRPFTMPPPLEPSLASSGRPPSDLPPTHPDWRMSSAGPLPDRPRRRIWFWVLGIIGGCLLVCVLLVLWGSTIGRPVLDDFATRAAIEATGKTAP
ncbi:MAG: zinc ribbon domain-containing protein [Thermomicrobiales bacterium]|nr:zinc ribbon domain-containing protein [Thermomicrobiales bacterium]